jgi:hypothetical protein
MKFTIENPKKLIGYYLDEPERTTYISSTDYYNDSYKFYATEINNIMFHSIVFTLNNFADVIEGEPLFRIEADSAINKSTKKIYKHLSLKHIKDEKRFLLALNDLYKQLKVWTK